METLTLELAKAQLYILLRESNYDKKPFWQVRIIAMDNEELLNKLYNALELQNPTTIELTQSEWEELQQAHINASPKNRRAV